MLLLKLKALEPVKLMLNVDLDFVVLNGDFVELDQPSALHLTLLPLHPNTRLHNPNLMLPNNNMHLLNLISMPLLNLKAAIITWDLFK